MKTTTQNTAYYLQVVFLALVIGIGLQIASAWTPPNSAPPTQSVTAPITTGTTAQIKQSSLSLAGNLIANQVQLNTVVTEGTACTSNGLVARSSTGLVLSCQSSVWSKAGGSSSATALTSYTMLPSGAMAGYCFENGGTTVEPAYHPSAGNQGCACRTGFTPRATGIERNGTAGILSNGSLSDYRYYICAKN